MKLVVLVRNDLPSVSYQGVQCGHAVAQFLLEHPDEQWKNSTLVYVKATPRQMEKVQREAEWWDLNYSTFSEPDLGGVQTTLAILVEDTHKNIVSGLELL